VRILRSWASPPADGSRSPERSHTGDAVRNRHHAGCRIAGERAADRYTLICEEPPHPIDPIDDIRATDDTRLPPGLARGTPTSIWLVRVSAEAPWFITFRGRQMASRGPPCQVAHGGLTEGPPCRAGAWGPKTAVTVRVSG
jgi:hypothetical protein